MYEQIARNKRRTVLLVIGALVFAGGLGFLFSYLILRNGFVGLVIALAIYVPYSFYSYRYGDRIVLRVSGARGPRRRCRDRAPPKRSPVSPKHGHGRVNGYCV